MRGELSGNLLGFLRDRLGCAVHGADIGWWGLVDRPGRVGCHFVSLVVCLRTISSLWFLDGRRWLSARHRGPRALGRRWRILRTMRSRTKDVSSSLTLGGGCTMGFFSHRCPLGRRPSLSLGRASDLWCRGVHWLRWEEWLACHRSRLLSILREEGGQGLWWSGWTSEEYIGAYRVSSVPPRFGSWKCE